MPAQLERMARRESPTPSPSPPPSSHPAAAGHHRPSALDALRHLAAPPASAEAPARAASLYGAPSPGLSTPNELGFAVAAQAGSHHAALPAAASPSMPPRFAEKQLPPEFLAGGASGLEDPSPSPPAHLAAAVVQRHGPGDEGYAVQQPPLAQAGAVRSSQQSPAAGFQTGSELGGIAAMTRPSDTAARTTVPNAQQPVGSTANEPPAPSRAGAEEPSQQQEQQQPDYDIAPEHQFRIVSSDDESSDSDNSNSGTGY